MLFLRAERTATTAAWWSEASSSRPRPDIIDELVRGDTSAVCDPREAHEAVGWARQLRTWSDGDPAVWIEDPFERRLRALADAPPPGVAP